MSCVCYCQQSKSTDWKRGQRQNQILSKSTTTLLDIICNRCVMIKSKVISTLLYKLVYCWCRGTEYVYICLVTLQWSNWLHDRKWCEINPGWKHGEFCSNVHQETGQPPTWRGLPITRGHVDSSLVLPGGRTPAVLRLMGILCVQVYVGCYK